MRHGHNVMYLPALFFLPLEVFFLPGGIFWSARKRGGILNRFRWKSTVSFTTDCILSINKQYHAFDIMVAIAPKWLLSRGVQKNMLVVRPSASVDVTKSVRGPVLSHRLERFACNAEPASSKTGYLSVQTNTKVKNTWCVRAWNNWGSLEFGPKLK